MTTRRSRLLTRIAAVLGVGLLTVAGVSPLPAQAPAYFQSLSVPPSTVGTCLESVQPNGKATTRASWLVMTHRSPSARREMSLTRDSTGAVIGYHETTHVSTARTTSVGESVVAARRADGSVAGHLIHIETSMSDSGLTTFDTASLRRRRENAKHSSTQSALDARAQDHVRSLITWLAKRCPS